MKVGLMKQINVSLSLSLSLTCSLDSDSREMSATKSDKRLYVGNLSVSVDELSLTSHLSLSLSTPPATETTTKRYALMQVCSKYGKIAKLDYLFHKSGPQRGQPRGYAFVEYATSNEAQLAQATLHNKVFRGRKLVVSLASEKVASNFLSLSLSGGMSKYSSTLFFY